MLKTERLSGGVTVLTFNRPERMNTLTTALVDELLTALDSVARDRECRAVILTGAGRAFCAGLDLAGYGTPKGAEGLGDFDVSQAIQAELASAVLKLRDLPVPVIAAVNGPATGGGMALAVAADVRVAGPSAVFAVSFVKVGLSGCDMGVSWILPRLIGTGRAYELMLTGRTVEATEAERIGLVNRIADGDVMDDALELAGLIAGNSPWGVRMTKEVMWSQLTIGSLEAGICLENRTQALAVHTGDMQEAIAAFMEKRAPRWA
jgi:enoyl-CoA hydratase